MTQAGPPPRLAIVGRGRMGRAIEQLARERGWEVTAVLDRSATASGITPSALAGADVAVEFTVPAAAAANVRALARAGVPVVVGTTGWGDALPDVEREVRSLGGALLVAPNFSVGVALFMALARRAGALMGPRAEFDAAIVETHHRAKRDAPSGTAAALARAVATTFGREVPISSVRVGHVPGTHELLFDAPFEQIRLTHVARDRRVFADGALQAAAWLRGRRGIFTLEDVLGLDAERAT